MGVSELFAQFVRPYRDSRLTVLTDKPTLSERLKPKRAKASRLSREELVQDQAFDATAEMQPDDLPTEAFQSDVATDLIDDLAEGTQGSANSQDRLTVLVIDDSKTIRRSATTLLNEEGWQVVTAEDGFEALGKVVEHKPDIVFADIMMPRLDGYQACALIKNNSEYRDIPVVMLSSKDSIFDKARGRIAGSEHYLTKPFTRRELVRAVIKHTKVSVAS